MEKWRDEFPDETEHAQHADRMGSMLFRAGLRPKIRAQVLSCQTLHDAIGYAVFIEEAWGLTPSITPHSSRSSKSDGEKKTSGILKKRYGSRGVHWQGNQMETTDEESEPEALAREILEASTSSSRKPKSSDQPLSKLTEKLGAMERKAARDMEQVKKRLDGQNLKFEGITHATNKRLDTIGNGKNREREDQRVADREADACFIAMNQAI